ncbi:MAG TPA: M23 family metallopeptidase [Flavitalea sp.]|nr:M23 family metallopeptidase [Flavitalea sp.]
MHSRIFLYFLFVTISTFAQPKMETYPKGYFRNPLDIPMNLSGNFGELRTNHYHMGFDLKTNARENMPVRAAADGYVARIKIEPAGFGRAIYINHPNGYTTLYAHLNEFDPAIEAYVKEKQYQAQSWAIQLEIPSGILPVKKGQFIAYSGNTGGSQAPHLHFEIRRTSDDVNLNPILFGFPLNDHTKPRIMRLGIYDRRYSVYEQTPKILSAKALGSGLYTAGSGVIIMNTPKISVAITSYDTHDGSANLNGVFSGTLKFDERPVSEFIMDNISYDDTRYLNAHIDYRLKQTAGQYLQHLSELPGYVHSIYQSEEKNGILDLSDGRVHSISIAISDGYNNKSVLNARVQYSGNESKIPEFEGKQFYPLMLDGFESEYCEFYIPEQGLYDSVYISHLSSPSRSQQALTDLHRIGNSTVPLQLAMVVRLRPTNNLTPEEQNRTIMQWSSGGKKAVKKVEWYNGWANAQFRDFGTFQLVLDEQPPVIVPIGFTNGTDFSKSSRLVFTVRDNFEKFNNVRAEIDGQWIRCSNDKGKTFIYRFDQHFPVGNHVLKITAEDEAGNKTESSYRISR